MQPPRAAAAAGAAPAHLALAALCPGLALRVDVGAERGVEAVLAVGVVRVGQRAHGRGVVELGAEGLGVDPLDCHPLDALDHRAAGVHGQLVGGAVGAVGPEDERVALRRGGVGWGGGGVGCGGGGRRWAAGRARRGGRLGPCWWGGARRPAAQGRASAMGCCSAGRSLTLLGLKATWPLAQSLRVGSALACMPGSIHCEPSGKHVSPPSSTSAAGGAGAASGQVSIAADQAAVAEAAGPPTRPSAGRPRQAGRGCARGHPPRRYMSTVATRAPAFSSPRLS
jgi:hypothetical protein